MRLFLIYFVLVVAANQVFCAEVQGEKPIVYFIPGQGADARLFKNIELDSSFEVQHINYFTPEKGSGMTEFAKELSLQIDTTRQFYLVGVSLGGMLAIEMGDFLKPDKIIVISSAKNRKEFPFRYRFQKTIPVYKIIPSPFVKMGARILQPIVEPDRNKDKETFISMLKDKDPKFLSRTVKMILEWDRIEKGENIVHIHGDNDHTLPARNIYFDYLVEDGSHMMVLTKGSLISELINEELVNAK
ncbi:alpha/beta hydrolase [uncultured Draconibacterium sp.]|uniref:alpha/beta hydrolase n=1 Tax=uncultured Draconibacterium sp. TaxID=1573823 RepID=UPI003216268E